jgi:hypothetical protein
LWHRINNLRRVRESRFTKGGDLAYRFIEIIRILQLCAQTGSANEARWLQLREGLEANTRAQQYWDPKSVAHGILWALQRALAEPLRVGELAESVNTDLATRGGAEWLKSKGVPIEIPEEWRENCRPLELIVAPPRRLFCLGSA